MTIKEAREKAGLTQKQVHDLLGIPIRSLQNWEAGLRVCPQYVENLIIREILNHSKVKRFLIVWEDSEGNYNQDYIQALNPDHGIEILGIRQKQVRDVAVCLPEYTCF